MPEKYLSNEWEWYFSWRTHADYDGADDEATSSSAGCSGERRAVQLVEP